MSYNTDENLLNRIRKYEGFELRRGKMLRYLLEDKDGNSVYCAECRNIANALKYEVYGHRLLNVPICVAHARELDWQEYIEDDLRIYKKSDIDAINILLNKNRRGMCG